MSEVPPFADQPAPEERPTPRGHPLLAWLLIVTVVVTVVLWQRSRGESVEAAPSGNRIQRNVMEIEGRYLVGLKSFLPTEKPDLAAKITEQLKDLGKGSLRQQWQVAILAGELGGPEQALERLDKLQPSDQENEKPSPEDGRLWESLHKLYQAYAKKRYEDILSKEESERLVSDLGWFGELALHPEDDPNQEARAEVIAPARKTALVFGVVFLGGAALAFSGFSWLLVFLVLLFRGTLRRRFVPGSSSGGVYAETFALWMPLFIGLTLLAALVPSGRSRLFVSGLFSVCSLVVLAWPVLRGVPWRQVRQDIGLRTGDYPGQGILYGGLTYLLSLPLLITGFIVVFILMALQKHLGGGLGGDGAPTHPIIGLVGEDWWSRIQVILVASFTAPLVEETMFRGVLYRHLREATRGTGFALSLILSGLINSFIFAVIHPQGLIAVPALMALAVGFSLAREWRGSLIPCMVAHGTSNGVVTLLLLVALSG
jgi:membrane protease YdiL (CAAX protease family)